MPNRRDALRQLVEAAEEREKWSGKLQDQLMAFEQWVLDNMPRDVLLQATHEGVGFVAYEPSILNTSLSALCPEGCCQDMMQESGPYHDGRCHEPIRAMALGTTYNPGNDIPAMSRRDRVRVANNIPGLVEALLSLLRDAGQNDMQAAASLETMLANIA